MLGLHSLPWLLVIELGDFRLNSATPWSEVAWFMAGVLILAGLSYLVLRLNRQPRPDPFDLGHEG